MLLSLPVRILIEFADALNSLQRILRPSIALFLYTQFLLPQVTEKRIFLRDGVVTETLRIIHAAAVGIFLNECLNAPLEVCRRLLRAGAKVNVIFDLESPDAVVKTIQFVIDSGHETVLAEEWRVAGQLHSLAKNRNVRDYSTRPLSLFSASHLRLSRAFCPASKPKS